MEGLIPMVYRAFKRHKVTRQYKCLSIGAAQTYHIADFFEDHHYNVLDDPGQNDKFYSPQMETRGRSKESTNGHRRFASTGEYEITADGYNGYYDHGVVSGGANGMNYSSPNDNQIIKRCRSHRMFSCFTGAL